MEIKLTVNIFYKPSRDIVVIEWPAETADIELIFHKKARGS
jgi:hypothetical protein